MLSALAGAACAPAPLLPYRPDQAPTVSLPVAQAGVVDARAAFAALFEQELKLKGSGAAPAAAAPERWLHRVPAAGDDTVTRLRAMNASFAGRAATTSVLIVPGMFGDCVDAQSVPFGDGLPRTRELGAVDSYRQYDDLGLRSVKAIPLGGRASSADNGRRLAQAIRAEAGRADVERIVVIAYSKGVPDTQVALAQMIADGGLPPKLVALVSVSGTVMGTPIADHYESLYQLLSPHLQPLDCSASDGRDIADLTRRERVAWLAANAPPPDLQYYSIVGHVPHDRVAPGLQAFQAQLSAVDPRNDGQMLAGDAVLPRSTLLAEVAADHWDVALPLDRHPNALVRALTSGSGFPRETLFRATVKWVVGSAP